MLEKQTEIEDKASTTQKFNLRKAATIGFIALVVFYGLSLILLNTSWAKNKLISRLYDKTNSDWDVGSVTWVPFGDVRLSDLTSTMGEGGIEIESLNISPSWKKLFSGRLNLTEVEIGKATLDVDLQWLKEQAAKRSDPIRQTPVIPKVTQQQAPKQLPPKPSRSNQASPKVKPANKPTAKPAENKIELDVRPNQWIKIKDLDIILRNNTKVINTVNSATIELPYFGKPNDGFVKFDFQGQSYNHKVHWDGNGLSAEDLEGGVFGLNYQWKVRSRKGRTIPFSVVFQLPAQPLKYSIDKPNIHLDVSSEMVSANFLMSGSLKGVNTWRAILNINSLNFVILENQKTHKKIEFDTVRLVGNLENGRLNIPHAEALGYKTSILANASIHSNLYSYGVVRLIANEEVEKFYNGVNKVTRCIHIDRGPHYLLSSLITSERKYCDLYLDGSLTNLEMRHNRSDHWQPLNVAIKKLRQFKNAELHEDGLLE